jgi:hypothetical protein
MIKRHFQIKYFAINYRAIFHNLFTSLAIIVINMQGSSLWAIEIECPKLQQEKFSDILEQGERKGLKTKLNINGEIWWIDTADRAILYSKLTAPGSKKTRGYYKLPLDRKEDFPDEMKTRCFYKTIYNNVYLPNENHDSVLDFRLTYQH